MSYDVLELCGTLIEALPLLYHTLAGLCCSHYFLIGIILLCCSWREGVKAVASNLSSVSA